MASVSELYLRAVTVALNRGLNAKGKVCTFEAGGFEFTINGTRETVDGLPSFHLRASRPGAFLPVAIAAPNGGMIAGGGGGDEFEAALIEALKPESAETDAP